MYVLSLTKCICWKITVKQIGINEYEWSDYKNVYYACTYTSIVKYFWSWYKLFHKSGILLWHSMCGWFFFSLSSHSINTINVFWMCKAMSLPGWSFVLDIDRLLSFFLFSHFLFFCIFFFSLQSMVLLFVSIDYTDWEILEFITTTWR